MSGQIPVEASDAALAALDDYGVSISRNAVAIALEAAHPHLRAATLRGVDVPLSAAYSTLGDIPDSAERRFVSHCIHVTMKRLSEQWDMPDDRQADRLWFEEMLGAFRRIDRESR